MNNQPVKIDDFTAFRENPFPIQVEFASSALIVAPVVVELWSNGSFYEVVPHEINSNFINFTTTPEQHRAIKRAAIYIKMAGSYDYTFPLTITLDGSVSEPQTRTVVAPSVGVVRVSSFSDPLTFAKAQDAIAAADRAKQYADEVQGTATGIINPVGTINAFTGIATETETGNTFTPTSVANLPNGSYLTIVVEGNINLTGSIIAAKVGGAFRSSGTKWSYIPPSDLAMQIALQLSAMIKSEDIEGYSWVIRDLADRNLGGWTDLGKFKPTQYEPSSIPGVGSPGTELEFAL